MRTETDVRNVKVHCQASVRQRVVVGFHQRRNVFVGTGNSKAIEKAITHFIEKTM